jgi:sporulation protein YlmC with PRC-barrel domain
MRAFPIAAVSVFALFSVAAFAQTTPPGGAAQPLGADAHGGLAGAATTPQRPLPNPLAQQNVAKISGAAVYGSDGKSIGSISTELMSPESKTINRLVVSSGGVLGVGTHYVAVPVDQFTWDTSKNAFTLARTAAQLDAMPQWHEQSAAMPNDATTGAGSGTPESAPGAK